MTGKKVEDLVAQLSGQDFFRALQDPTIGDAQKNALRSERIEEYLDKTLNSASGKGLAAWGEHIEAEIRSGVSMQEIVQEIRKLQSVEQEAGEFGLYASRKDHGYKLEGVRLAAHDAQVAPDKVTPETSAAFEAAREKKKSAGLSTDA